jgi:hypothetical protein
LGPGLEAHPPTQFCPQITQIDADGFLRVNLRYLRHLRGVVLGFEGRHVLIERNGLPFGGIQHPASLLSKTNPEVSLHPRKQRGYGLVFRHSR